jgi:triosephosphate isomerase
MKKLIAGNWKMHGTREQAKVLIADIVNNIHKHPGLLDHCDFLVCPPFLYLGVVRHSLHNVPHITIGGQDCSLYGEGAYTGDISAGMLKDVGCKYVILGHSERRQYQNESSDVVRQKAEKAHAAGLITIICVGEKEKERDAGRAEDVVKQQLIESLPASARADNTVIAYEPVWAIGTGKTATPGDIAAMHGFIRKRLQEKLENAASVRILYGGSVKPENASAIFAVQDVNGALIGGASLKAGQFLGIAQAA